MKTAPNLTQEQANALKDLQQRDPEQMTELEKYINKQSETLIKSIMTLRDNHEMIAQELHNVSEKFEALVSLYMDSVKEQADTAPREDA